MRGGGGDAALPPVVVTSRPPPSPGRGGRPRRSEYAPPHDAASAKASRELARYFASSADAHCLTLLLRVTDERALGGPAVDANGTLAPAPIRL